MFGPGRVRRTRAGIVRRPLLSIVAVAVGALVVAGALVSPPAALAAGPFRAPGATVAATAVNTAPDFTFMLIPDTQNYVSTAANRPIMSRQTQWIADTRRQLNTAFVTHLGDLVGVETNATQWQAASTSMATLDNAGVPNTVLPGNHDLNLTTGTAALYQQYFPVSRYAGASWNSATAAYGGYLGQNQFGADPVNRQNLDNYALFTAGGMDFLLLNLEFNTPDYVIDWAKRVLAAHPNRRAIVATHSYVNFNGQLSTQMDRADAGNSPAQLWSKLISGNCSIFLVVNGHFNDGDRSEARRSDTNSCGGTVQEVLSDYQGRANGGDGWLRYYTFKPAANEIQAVTYSPTLDRYETDADSAFTMPYDMGGASAPTVLARDGFGRTLTNTWGGAEVGGAWTTTGGTTRFSVANGDGIAVTPAGVTTTAALGPVPGTATDTSVQVRLDAVPNAVTHLSVAGRRVGSSIYAAKVKVAATGATDLRIYTGSTDLTAGVPFGTPLAAGQRLAVRIQVEGTSPTTIRARAWKVGSTEPTGWTVTATDSTANLQTAGGASVSTYLSSAATSGPATIRWDDLLITPLGMLPPPANVAPTAAFTTSVAQLQATVNGSGSSDPDGTIATYDWVFGDGGTASGVSATHTYPAAGTYPVTLTVTDDDGATGVRTGSVTVTAPPGSTVLAADAFARTVANGWGSADTGGAWTVTGGTGSSVAGGQGVHLAAAGTTKTATMSGVSSSSIDVVTQFGVDAVPDGTVYVTVAGRTVGSAQYAVQPKILATGAVTLGLVASGTTLTSGTLTGVTLAAGQKMLVRLQVQGTSPTTLRARAWKAGEPEPTTWRLTATDSTPALQVPGGVRISSYLSSSATTGPTTVRYDDLRALALPFP